MSLGPFDIRREEESNWVQAWKHCGKTIIRAHLKKAFRHRSAANAASFLALNLGRQGRACDLRSTYGTLARAIWPVGGPRSAALDPPVFALYIKLNWI